LIQAFSFAWAMISFTVQTLSGEVVALTSREGESIRDAKLKIEQALEIPARFQDVAKNVTVMQDNSRIEQTSYHVVVSRAKIQELCGRLGVSDPHQLAGDLTDLGHLGSKADLAVVRAVAAFLEDDRGFVRDAALGSISRMSTADEGFRDEVVPVLQRLCEDPCPTHLAATALAKFAGLQAGNAAATRIIERQCRNIDEYQDMGEHGDEYSLDRGDYFNELAEAACQWCDNILYEVSEKAVHALMRMVNDETMYDALVALHIVAECWSPKAHSEVAVAALRKILHIIQNAEFQNAKWDKGEHHAVHAVLMNLCALVSKCELQKSHYPSFLEETVHVMSSCLQNERIPHQLGLSMLAVLNQALAGSSNHPRNVDELVMRALLNLVDAWGRDKPLYRSWEHVTVAITGCLGSSPEKEGRFAQFMYGVLEDPKDEIGISAALLLTGCAALRHVVTAAPAHIKARIKDLALIQLDRMEHVTSVELVMDMLALVADACDEWALAKVQGYVCDGRGLTIKLIEAMVQIGGGDRQLIKQIYRRVSGNHQATDALKKAVSRFKKAHSNVVEIEACRAVQSPPQPNGVHNDISVIEQSPSQYGTNGIEDAWDS